MVVLVFFGILFLALLGMVVAFIREFIKSKDFRDDLLAQGNENEITIGPLSAKGVLFFGVLALFLGVIVYMFVQFLEHTGGSTDQEAESANNALVKRNKELSGENIKLENRIIDLEKKIENLKLNLIKQSAIMDVYKNTRILAYLNNTAIENKPTDNVITIVSSRLGNFSELSASKGTDLTPLFTNKCNQKDTCEVKQSFWVTGGEKPTELIVEYMCSGEYRMHRKSIQGREDDAVKFQCKST